MASTPMRGAGISLSAPNTIFGLSSNELSLGAGRIFNLPAGSFLIDTGPYSFVQFLDPVTQTWQDYPTDGASVQQVNSDGANYRVINLSGCVIRALVTTAGSGYTNGIYVNGVSTTTGLAGLTATTSAGGATWTTVVGGAISTTITLVTGGSGYSIAPNVLISAPPAGGIQATAIATISAGAVTGFTVINQGAGYVNAPLITIIPQPFDTATVAATATTALTGTGTLTAMYPNYNGTPLTAVPTLSFSAAAGSGAVATSVMNFATTGITVTNAGVAYAATAAFAVISTGGIVAGTAAYTNPSTQAGLTLPRMAQYQGTTTGGGVITATGLVAVDQGIGFQAIPTAVILPTGTTVPTTGATATFTVGGVTDSTTIQPM